jgi:hypothetical protein
MVVKGLAAALRLIVQPCDEDEEKDDQFYFFQVMEYRWNEIDRRIPKYLGGKIRPSATLSTTNPTSTDPGSNLGLCGERTATNRLSHGTAVCYDISDRRLENAVIFKLCLKREADDFCTFRICSSCMP